MKTYTAKTDAAGLHDGTKTMLVLPMEPQPDPRQNTSHFSHDPQAKAAGRPWFGVQFCRHTRNIEICDERFERIVCPYAPGDIIGVKEACYITPWKFCDTRREYNFKDRRGRRRDVGYTADMGNDAIRCALEFGVRKTCASQMPLWAIRTRLLCESVEARQVQSITEKEAEATGVEREVHGGVPLGWQDYSRPKGCSVVSAEASFATLWDHRHPDLPWAVNGWVWFFGVRNVSVAELEKINERDKR